MSSGMAESPEELKIRSTTEALMQAADRLGLVMSADVRVSEEGAAALLGCSRPHLKALRQGGDSPMHYSIGVDGGRVSYRLTDLASWIESRREDPYKYSQRR